MGMEALCSGGAQAQGAVEGLGGRIRMGCLSGLPTLGLLVGPLPGGVQSGFLPSAVPTLC